MGVAQTKTFVLDLTTSAASKRQKAYRTYPLLQLGFQQGPLGSPQNRQCSPASAGFHAIVGMDGLFGGVGVWSASRSLERCSRRPDRSNPRGALPLTQELSEIKVGQKLPLRMPDRDPGCPGGVLLPPPPPPPPKCRFCIFSDRLLDHPMATGHGVDDA